MKYRTTCAVLIKGDRVPRGTIVDLEPELAANLGSDLVVVEDAGEEKEETVPEKTLAEMTAAELKVKAESLGLSKSGSAAQIRERIELHLAGGEKEEVEETN